MRGRSFWARWLFLGVAATLVFALIGLSVEQGPRFSFAQKILVEIFAPAEKFLSQGISGAKELLEGYVLLVHTKQENEALKKEVAKLRARLVEYREALIANARLKKLLELKQSLPYASLSAQVVGRDPSMWFRSLIIDLGGDEGLEEGMAVITVGGVVGQILGVTPNYAKVMLITDPNSAVDVVVQRSRARGILRGQGSETCNLEYVSMEADVREGDLLITSGLDGIFPKGLLVGIVKRVLPDRQEGLFQRVEVRPAINLEDIEEVLVILRRSSLANQERF
ncbi:rod shape-determining protein MreC [Thermosulfuriphilus sp.]